MSDVTIMWAWIWSKWGLLVHNFMSEINGFGVCFIVWGGFYFCIILLLMLDLISQRLIFQESWLRNFQSHSLNTHIKSCIHIITLGERQLLWLWDSLRSISQFPQLKCSGKRGNERKVIWASTACSPVPLESNGQLNAAHKGLMKITIRLCLKGQLPAAFSHADKPTLHGQDRKYEKHLKKVCWRATEGQGQTILWDNKQRARRPEGTYTGPTAPDMGSGSQPPNWH